MHGLQHGAHLGGALREGQAGSKKTSRDNGPSSRAGCSHVKEVCPVSGHALQLGDGPKASQLGVGQENGRTQFQLQEKVPVIACH